MKTKMKKPVAKKPAGLVAKKTADAIGWSVGIAGALMFLFGIILFLNPAQTLEASVFLLGFVLLVAGGLKLLEGLVFAKKSGLAGFFVTTGLVTALFGAIMVLMPGAVALGVFLTFGVLVLMLAFLALVGGVWQIMFALKNKRRSVLLLMGLLYILFGIFVLINPLVATITMLSMMGLFAMFYGMLLIMLAGYVRDALA